METRIQPRGGGPRARLGLPDILHGMSYNENARGRPTGTRRSWMARLVLLGLAGSVTVVAAPTPAVTEPAPDEPTGRRIVVGPAGQPMAFAKALAEAQDGDTIELLPGEYKGVTGVIAQKKLTLRGVGQRPVFVADGKHADGKGSSSCAMATSSSTTWSSVVPACPTATAPASASRRDA